MEVEWPEMLKFLAVSFILTSSISRSTRGAFHWRKTCPLPERLGIMNPDDPRIRKDPDGIPSLDAGKSRCWWPVEQRWRNAIGNPWTKWFAIEVWRGTSSISRGLPIAMCDYWRILEGNFRLHSCKTTPWCLDIFCLTLLVPWLDLFTILVELKMKFKTWLRSSPLSPKLWCFFWKSFWSWPSRFGQLWSAMVSCLDPTPSTYSNKSWQLPSSWFLHLPCALSTQEQKLLVDWWFWDIFDVRDCFQNEIIYHHLSHFRGSPPHQCWHLTPLYILDAPPLVGFPGSQ